MNSFVSCEAGQPTVVNILKYEPPIRKVYFPFPVGRVEQYEQYIKFLIDCHNKTKTNWFNDSIAPTTHIFHSSWSLWALQSDRGEKELQDLKKTISKNKNTRLMLETPGGRVQIRPVKSAVNEQGIVFISFNASPEESELLLPDYSLRARKIYQIGSLSADAQLVVEIDKIDYFQQRKKRREKKTKNTQRQKIKI